MKDKQIKIAVGKTCDHAVVRFIENYGGEIIAQYCSACGVRMWERGDCDLCGVLGGKMTRFVSKRGLWRRFCNGICQGYWEESEREKRKCAAVSTGVAEKRSGGN